MLAGRVVCLARWKRAERVATRNFAPHASRTGPYIDTNNVRTAIGTIRVLISRTPGMTRSILLEPPPERGAKCMKSQGPADGDDPGGVSVGAAQEVAVGDLHRHHFTQLDR